MNASKLYIFTPTFVYTILGWLILGRVRLSNPKSCQFSFCLIFDKLLLKQATLALMQHAIFKVTRN